jgi:hypothetical protein
VLSAMLLSDDEGRSSSLTSEASMLMTLFPNNGKRMKAANVAAIQNFFAQ